MNVVLAGQSASGKTYFAKRLAARLGRRHISVGQLLLHMLELNGEQIAHAWTTMFDEISRIRDCTDIDRRLDETVLDLCSEHDDLVFDSWALPWLGNDSVTSFWIHCDEEIRVRKAADAAPERTPEYVDWTKVLRRKDEDTGRRFMELYGFAPNPDPNVFTAVFDTTLCYLAEPDAYRTHLEKAILDRMIMAMVSR